MTTNPESDKEACLEELLAGYVLGNLDEAELTWLNRKFLANPELREQVKELEVTLNLMPYGLPEEHPQTNLQDSILAKAQSQFPVNPKFNRWGWIIAGVTALSTLWFGWQSYNLRQQLAQTNHQLQQQELMALLSQPNNRLVSFQGLDGLTTSSGSIFISPESQKAVLALQNLESLSGQQVYRLWAVSQGKKTGCVNFTPDKQGRVYLELSNNALDDASILLITIEPKADTAQPLGNTILTGSYANI